MLQKKSKEVKICISAAGNTLDSFLDPRFGRAMYFLIVDSKGKLIKAIKNTGAQAMRGAGVMAAQIVSQEKVKAVITENIGPNSFMVLNSSGIKIFIGPPGMIIKDVFKEYQKNNLQEATEMTSHPTGPGPSPSPGSGFGNRGGGNRGGWGGKGRRGSE